jgi:hypothetical protein
MNNRNFEPPAFSIKGMLYSFLYFFAISILINFYITSLSYTYQFDKVITKVISAIIHPLWYLYFPMIYLGPITATISRYFNLWKTVVISFLIIFFWLLWNFYHLNSESFGYIFMGAFVPLGCWFAGLIIGNLSRYFK